MNVRCRSAVLLTMVVLGTGPLLAGTKIGIDPEYLTETPSTDFVYCSPVFAPTLRLNLSTWTEKTTTSTCWPSYFAASCGGAPIIILKDYIQQQKTPL
jgi:hypothetical protein